MSTGATLWHHGGLEPSTLHDQRLHAVAAAVGATSSRCVLDIGCGSGLVIDRLLALSHTERVVGLDSSSIALAQARERFGYAHPQVELRLGDFNDVVDAAGHYDAITMVEVIEHLPPSALSCLETFLFVRMRPALVVITTPNAEWNTLLNLQHGRFRHPEHRFEWSRGRFRSWATGVADRRDYRVAFEDIGEWVPGHGAPSQLARFRLIDPAAAGKKRIIPVP